MKNDFFYKYYCPTDDTYSIVIEANTKVVYAYLLENEEMITDVWLFNLEIPPTNILWNDPDDLPFQNRQELIKTAESHLFYDNFEKDDINWSIDSNGNFEHVDIKKDNKIFARLSKGRVPGYCCNAKVSGPLASAILV